MLNSQCPRSGRAVRADSLATYRGHTVGFCNGQCRDDFTAHPERYADERALFDALIAAGGARTAGCVLDRINDHLLLAVFQHLPFVDVVHTLPRVCRRFRRVAHDSALWRTYALRILWRDHGPVGSPVLDVIPLPLGEQSAPHTQNDPYSVFRDRYLSHIKHEHLLFGMLKLPRPAPPASPFDPLTLSRLDEFEATHNLRFPSSLRFFLSLRNIKQLIFKVTKANENLLDPWESERPALIILTTPVRPHNARPPPSSPTSARPTGRSDTATTTTTSTPEECESPSTPAVRELEFRIHHQIDIVMSLPHELLQMGLQEDESPLPSQSPPPPPLDPHMHPHHRRTVLFRFLERRDIPWFRYVLFPCHSADADPPVFASSVPLFSARDFREHLHSLTLIHNHFSEFWLAHIDRQLQWHKKNPFFLDIDSLSLTD